jgi:hypothetical protein
MIWLAACRYLPKSHLVEELGRNHGVAWCENWTETEGLSQEYAKHNARYDNLPQDATHPRREREESNALKIS